MIAAGVAFAVVHDYALLLVIALTGTINPSAGNVSVFVPLEHAAFSAAVRDSDRTKMFARYSLVGTFAAAAGALEVLDGVGRVRFDVNPVTDSFCRFLKLACYSIPPEIRLWSGSTLC